MKKIFYILVSAIVALGAVACNNELDENIEANRSEGVSFTASLDETASRVLIGDLTDGKHPIAFENDDVIYASLEYDYSAPFVFTTTDGVKFTCTEVNANGQLPEVLIGKQVYFMVNRQKMVDGQTLNSATGVDGIFFCAEVYDFENNSTVTLGLQDYYGVFAFTSPYDVTLEASTHIFIIGSNIRNSITIPQAEGTQYVGFMNQMGVEFTLSYSVNGQKVKEITRGYYNKIYTLGGLTEAVATVNGKNYTDIAKAVEAAGEAGVPVLVMDDCEATSAITLAEGKTVAIDLGGHTITFDENATEAIGFVNNGTMSITNGVIAGVASEANKDVITNNGTMTISGVTISQNYKTGAAIANYGNLTIDGNDTEVTTIGSTVRNDDTAPDAVLTINGGKFVQTGTYAANGTSKYNVDGRNGKVVINGGEFVSNNGVLNAGCDVTINGGTFNSEITSAATRHLAYITGAMTINGGTFESIANSSAGGECFCLNRSTAKLVINDGYFASYWSGSMKPNAVISIYATGATYEVNAGYFSNNKVAGLSYAANTDSATSAKYPYIVKKPVVATVGGQEYADLAKAVVAAAEAGEEVVLSDDAVVTEPIAIPTGTEVTIDLNGNVITADNTTYAFNNLGTLTLKDSNAGAIPSSSSVMSKTGAEIAWSVSARGIYNGYVKDGDPVSTAKLIIESGNYQATGTNGGAAVYNYGILEVKGGYFKSNGGYGLNNQATGVMTIENAEINGGIYNVGTLTVKEGTKLLQHLSGKHAIYNSTGSVTINGGEFDSLSGNELILADGTNATVIINNGTFKKTAKSWLFGAATGKNISFVINGGKFYGYVNQPEMSVDTIRPYGDPIVVKGGMFNFNPTKWLAEGYAMVDNGDGTYTVVKQAYVINQNGEYEISSKEGLMWLADAVNSGNEEIAGKTIVLTSDIDLEGENWTPIGFNENGIVEDTDKYFTGTFDGKGYTIRNLNIENDNAGGVGLFGAVHNATFKNFTLENVNIKAVDADASTDSSGAQGQANYIVGGHIGAVAAYDAKAGTVTFDNVHLKGLIKIEGETRYAQGQRVAGVFGGKSSSKVVFNNVSVKGDNGSYIKGYCSTAGVVGQHMGVGTFTEVHTDIDVYGVTFGVGGIAGITLKGSTFENCSSAGDLTLDASAVQPASYSGNYFFRVGGIAGCWSESANAELTLTNCSYTGTLKSFNKEGKSPYAFDYDGYVGRGYTLNGCAGSTVIIDGKEFVQVAGNIHGFYMVDGVYEIMNAASLTWFANEVSANKNTFSDKTVKLINDIDLSTIDNWTPIGIAAADTHFQGTFDGNNKTISGLTIKERSNGKPQAALFGSVAGTVTIKDLTIDGANIVYPQDGADFYGAALVGTYYGNVTVQNVTVQNSYISGNNKVAGILAHDGSSSKLLVDGCKVLNSTIETTDTNDGGNVGGVLGLFQQTTSGVENIIRNTTVKGCTINGINSSDSGKRANGQIVGSVIMKKEDTVLKLQDCTVEGNTFVNGNTNYVSPYGDGSLVGGYREGNGYYMGQVYINGVLCEKKYAAKVGDVGYDTIDDAIAAANGATITLLADATVSAPCQIDKNNFKLTVDGDFLVLKNYKNDNGYYDVVAATTKSTYRIRGAHANDWAWADATPLYKIENTHYYVAQNVKFAAGSAFKFCGAENWSTQYGKGADAINQNAWIKLSNNGGSADITIAQAGTYDIYFTEAGYIHVVAADSDVIDLTVATADFYLNPNIWSADSPRYSAYFCNGSSTAKFVKMVDSDYDGLYEVNIPSGENHKNIIFCRMNPANTTDSWSNKWNQTGDLVISNNTGKVYKITAWGSDKSTGTWSTK